MAAPGRGNQTLWDWDRFMLLFSVALTCDLISMQEDVAGDRLG